MAYVRAPRPLLATTTSTGGTSSPGAGPSSAGAGPSSSAAPHPSGAPTTTTTQDDADYRYEGRLYTDTQPVEECGIAVHGQYGSKIEAVVRRILYLLTVAPENKILVFSTWRDVLSVLSHALQENGVDHLFPGGGGAGNTFAQDVARFRGRGDGVGHYQRKGKTSRGGGKRGGAGGGGKAHAGGRGVGRRGVHGGVHGGGYGQQEGGPRVLLLMTKQGGKGLNLTGMHVACGYTVECGM